MGTLALALTTTLTQMLRDTAEMEERITQATHKLKAETAAEEEADVKADAEEQAEAKVVAETWTVAEADDDYVIQSNREQAHTHTHSVEEGVEEIKNERN